MRLFASIGIILLVIVLQSHCQLGQDLTKGATPQNLELVSRSVTNLAQKISLAIASPKSKTELFSPVSIAGALSLLLLGSGNATKDELIELLGFRNQPISFTDIHKSFGKLFQELVSNEPSMDAKIPWRENDKCNNPDYDYDDDTPSQSKFPSNQRGKRDVDSHFISVANGVFLDNNLQLNSNYEDLTKELYKGEVSRKPLLSNPVRSSNEINRWVQEATRNKIPEIVSPEQVSNAPMVLVSALYFKAKWETMFIEPDTRPRPFYINGRESPPTDIYTMATSGCFPFYEDKQLDFKMVGLPYQEEKSTMYIIMPSQSDRQKIRNFQNRVNLGQMNGFIDKMVVKTGTVLLPKMKLENTLGLKDVLELQGLHTVFNLYLSNLTGITKKGIILENVNQPRTTSNPKATKRIQSSTRPTPTYPPSNPQDTHNTNQRIPSTSPAPQNPPSVKPLPPTQSTHSPDVPYTDGRPIIFAFEENECLLINNCQFDGHMCSCYLNQRINKDSRGCYPKPWIIETSCSPDLLQYSLNGFAVCRARSFNKYPKHERHCPAGCLQDKQSCYYCNLPVSSVSQSTQQVTTPRSAVDSQQMSIPSFQVENRFDQYPVSTIHPAHPHDIGNRFNPNTDSTSPLAGPCQIVDICDFYRNNCNRQCYGSNCICPLVNNERTRHAGNSGRRYKRQAPNNPSPPPNLYVGDVLHKVSLDINEQGTEGGAVTAVVIDRISSAFNLRVDGPFLIYLRNDVTKLPLFYGAVFDPRS